MLLRSQEVITTVEAMTQALHDKNIDAVMSFYEDNATIVFEPGKPVTDNVVSREQFLGLFQLNPKFTFSAHDVVVQGNVATHTAKWQMTGMAPDGNKGEQGGQTLSH